jgi:dimethylamine monooxygenase subunit A
MAAARAMHHSPMAPTSPGVETFLLPSTRPPALPGADFEAAVSAPFRMQPGLRKLAPGATQLTPLAPGARHQREKLAVLSHYASQALLQVPGFDAGPALHALATHAATEHPQHWRWHQGLASALQLGCGVRADTGDIVHTAAGGFGLGDEVARCLQGLPAGWRLAGLLNLAFAEDFAVIDGHAQRCGLIPWMAVTLPSFWAPDDKIGKVFTEVHAPVADNRLLLQAADALTRMVTGDQRWERHVWTVTPHTRLHAHPARVSPERWGSGFDPHVAWWRSERQTFIPVPGAEQAVFTIRIDVQPLAGVVAAAPARAARLHDALASMSPAVLDYRGLTPVQQPLLRWLAEQASPEAAP